MTQCLCFQMTDEMLQTELWNNRERRSLFLRVPFESPHLHHPSHGLPAVATDGRPNPKGNAGATPFRTVLSPTVVCLMGKRRQNAWANRGGGEFDIICT